MPVVSRSLSSGGRKVWVERRFTTLTFVKNLLLKSAKINRYERILWVTEPEVQGIMLMVFYL